MAFLDNSGDIILDAVLTDAGRQRMARGEFKIVKYAFGDEEINYALFNGNHPSGSAFADIKIMQTPVMEAFTNNTSLMKTKLISLNRNNILFLPILRVNERPAFDSGVATSWASKANQGSYKNGWILLADKATKDALNPGGVHERDPGRGIFVGHANPPEGQVRHICIDQGIETGGKVPPETPMPDDLRETAYLVRMDHRLMRLSLASTGDKEDDNALGPSGVPRQIAGDILQNSFVDDDGIATYYLPRTHFGPSAATRAAGIVAARGHEDANKITKAITAESFNGPLGPRLRFAPKSSLHIQQTDALFDEIGKTVTSGKNIVVGASTLTAYKFIDTLINVVGVTTGHSIDLPIRIIKKT